MFNRRPHGQQLPEFTAPSTGRPRIVLENADGAERFIESRILTEAGYDVVGCAGPDELQDHHCPVVEGGDCPAMLQADAVVTSFRVERPEGAAIVRSVRQRYPGLPVIVEAPPAAEERAGDVLDGCHVLFPLTEKRLLAKLDTVFARVTT